MKQTKQYKTRKQKLSYIKGISTGAHEISELGPSKFYMFILTYEPGIYYSGDMLEGNKPVPIDGKMERYTLKDIEEFKKRPGFICMTCEFSDKRPPFPDVDENGKLIPPVSTV